MLSGGFYGVAGALAGSVNAGGVGEIRGEIGKHGVEDAGVDWSGGVIVEVDAIHGDLNRIAGSVLG